MMIRSRRFKKFLAVFFLMTLVYEIGFPVAAYALTAGPTTPDATSFEPVDTTDMVNLLTGDFTYNIPLLEVPGPEGGYPLSLSYHAGIQTNEEASWVGLGWTLNPGAITRNVNGYADDWNGVYQDRRDFWSGGSVATFGIDVGIGLKMANISSGLTWTSHNGKGFSVSMQAPRVGASWVSTSGGASVGFSADLATGDVAVSANLSDVGEETIEDRGTGQQKSITGNNSIGVSLSTKSGLSASSNAYSRTVSGGTFYNRSAGKISSESGGWGISFPLYGLNIGLKSSYYRYWSDQSDLVSTYGSMYSGNGFGQIGAGTVFDSYYLPENLSNQMATPDLEYQAGAALPDFDDYQVNAQGINGLIRPYLYKGNVVGRNRESGIIGSNYVTISDNGSLPQQPTRPITYKIAASSLGNQNPIANFRFINDVSNTYQQALTDFVDGSLNAQYATATTGDGISSGYDATSNYLEGSKHIEYFTNEDIMSTDPASKAKKKGFVGIPQESNVFTRVSNKTIGGFSITAANGVTYHFALPAYNKGEMSYTEKIKTSADESTRWTKERKREKYAYTWYLTAITGPDFVDRDGNGYASDADFGYWVNFDYGRWFDNYNWRNPSEGFSVDVDNEFQNFSHGVKEIYYLNAIRTRTHTAIFEKDARSDGHGVDANWLTTYSSTTPYLGSFSSGAGRVLKLNRILLLNNADAVSINPAAGTGIDQTGYLGNKVIDKYDLANTQIESKSIKIIQLEQDYSLCPNTPNSFNESTPGTKLGKLTLKGLKVLGKGGADMMPATDFEYETRGEDVMSMEGTLYANSPYVGTVTTQAYSYLGTKRALALGDLVNVSAGDGKTYTGYVSSSVKNSDSRYTIVVEFVGSIPFPSTTSAYIRVTKNPNYDREAYDKWGMFKCDADGGEIATNVNAGRMTSVISAKHTDAWSLRRISTPMGANLLVDYESDAYSNAVLTSRNTLSLQNFFMDPANQAITFNVSNTTRRSLSSLFPVGSKIDMRMLQFGFDVSSLPDRLMSTPFVLSTATGINTITYYYNRYVNSTLVRSSTIMAVGGGFTQSFTVKSINETAGTVTIHCMDPFIFGTANKTMTFLDGTTRTFRLNGTPLAGNVFYYNYLDPNQVIYGGGIRVKELEIQDGQRAVGTSYSYNSIDNNTSSGVTTYEPNTIEPIAFTPELSELDGLDAVKARIKTEYRIELSPNHGRIMGLARLLPAPGVFYEYVTTSSVVRNATATGTTDDYVVPGKATYQFVVPYSNMVTFQLNKQYNSTTIGTRNYSMMDKTGAIGTLRRKITYDNIGNKLTEVINSSLYDDLDPVRIARYKKQGEITERFVEAKQYKDEVNMSRDVAIMTARTEIANIPTSQTVIDYKKNTKEYTDYLAYDFYSAALTKMVETDAYGNTFRTDIVPAYRIYPGMGLKVTDNTNKHMLTQEAATYVYKVAANDYENELGLVSANVQTWSNAVPALVSSTSGSVITQNSTANGNVWRKQAAYSWKPTVIPPATTPPADGLTPTASFVDFNWSNPGSSAANWKKQGEATLYDVYSHALEERNINNVYSAVVMGYNNSRVIVTGSAAKSKELAFSGAEDAPDAAGKFSGGVSKGSGAIEPATTGSFPVATAHTGYKSLKVGAGLTGFSYSMTVSLDEASKQYIASVWVKSSTTAAPVANIYYQVNGGALVSANVVAARKAGDWYLLSILTPSTAAVSGNTITFGCKNTGTVDMYFDDFRVRPVSASSTAYVYDTQTGDMTYTLDNNNLFARYEYDAMGRLLRTYRETFSSGVFVTDEYAYNYGKKRVYNTSQSRTFTKQCTPGYIASSSTYTVNAGTYYGSTLEEANNLALADIAANGQARANATGTCTAPGASATVTSNSYAVVLKKIIFYPLNGVGTYQSIDLFGSSVNIGVTPGTYNIYVFVESAGASHVRLMDAPLNRCVNVAGSTIEEGSTDASYSNITISSGHSYQFTANSGSCN
jgi:hypothetical protein